MIGIHLLIYIFDIYGFVYFFLIVTLGFILFKKMGWTGWPFKEKYEIKSWMSSSISFLYTELIVGVILQIDFIILEMVGAYESDVGIFGALMALVQFIWIVYSAVLFFSMPEISSCFHEKKYAQLGVLANRIQFKLAFFTLFLILVIMLSARPILTWLEPQLAGYTGLFLFIFIGVVISLPSYLKVTIFTMSEYRRIQSIINIICFWHGLLPRD